LNDKGFIINSDQSLLNKAGVYIYQSILDPEKFYIGSTCDLYIRFNQHRTLVINRFTDCPKFYNHVQKYGWENLRFGIYEPTVREQHSGKDIKEIRKIITDREQNYLKLYSPTLNVNPEANSRLGAKFS
jgi:group I intron endonuclease